MRQSNRRVVCAAVRSEDGDVVIGIRHYCPVMRGNIAVRDDGDKFLHRYGDDQGFVDQYGDYLTREEALTVAKAAGQIYRRCGGDDRQLFSENLY